ncbi:OLC1v1008689C1 [Oldenlandia corymbosa var. corymbosa]|uniref:OLC1v1008689C1 n=1 Tax=Oldenlandia corymbosa var. corymbosa TaxID=529605 RepID=A0AAV1DM58_OLDCO|nr:OLC1v1008689C1 [Oldenlandia corymbosa var. corymbosa]
MRKLSPVDGGPRRKSPRKRKEPETAAKTQGPKRTKDIVPVPQEQSLKAIHPEAPTSNNDSIFSKDEAAPPEGPAKLEEDDNATKKFITRMSPSTLLSWTSRPCRPNFLSSWSTTLGPAQESTFPNGEHFKIEEEDVLAVLDLPRGKKEVELFNKSEWLEEEHAPFVELWKRRFDPKKGKTQYPRKSCPFLVLKSLKDVNQIKEYNWCAFTIKALIEEVEDWKKQSNFSGPLLFFLLMSPYTKHFNMMAKLSRSYAEIRDIEKELGINPGPVLKKLLEKFTSMLNTRTTVSNEATVDDEDVYENKEFQEAFELCMQAINCGKEDHIPNEKAEVVGPPRHRLRKETKADPATVSEKEDQMVYRENQCPRTKDQIANEKVEVVVPPRQKKKRKSKRKQQKSSQTSFDLCITSQDSNISGTEKADEVIFEVLSSVTEMNLDETPNVSSLDMIADVIIEKLKVEETSVTVPINIVFPSRNVSQKLNFPDTPDIKRDEGITDDLELNIQVVTWTPEKAAESVSRIIHHARKCVRRNKMRDVKEVPPCFGSPFWLQMKKRRTVMKLTKLEQLILDFVLLAGRKEEESRKTMELFRYGTIVNLTGKHFGELGLDFGFESYLKRIKANDPGLRGLQAFTPALTWQNTENHKDCDVYAMHHMEFYNGEEEAFTAPIAGKDSSYISNFRTKYLARILLSPETEMLLEVVTASE